MDNKQEETYYLISALNPPFLEPIPRCRITTGPNNSDSVYKFYMKDTNKDKLLERYEKKRNDWIVEMLESDTDERKKNHLIGEVKRMDIGPKEKMSNTKIITETDLELLQLRKMLEQLEDFDLAL